MKYLIWFFILIYIFIIFKPSPIQTYIPYNHSEEIHITLSSKNFTKEHCFSSPKIDVFMYHYVRDDDPNDTPTTRALSVTPKNFEFHMKRVSELAKEKKITLMTMENFVKAFENRCFPGEKIWIFTSDDGWIDNADYLAPIADKYQVPFIFWIISGKIWEKGFINHEQLKKISENPLFGIASHSITHRAMSTLSEKEETTEMCDSKKDLEKFLKKTVNVFIYPTGKISKNSQKILEKCWYSLAWSTSFWKKLDWNHPEKFIMNRVRVSHDMGSNIFDDIAK